MSYLVRWDNQEKTVVFQQYTGIVVKDDLYGLAEKSAQLLNSVSHTVHIIIDEGKSKLTLNSADLEYLDKLVPANQGVVVTVVNENNLAYKKYIQNIGKKMGAKAFEQSHFVTSMEAARQILEEQCHVQYP